MHSVSLQPFLLSQTPSRIAYNKKNIDTSKQYFTITGEPIEQTLATTSDELSDIATFTVSIGPAESRHCE